MYMWRVLSNNRFAGYVNSPSQQGAYIMAKEKYGEYVTVERTSIKPDIGKVLAKQSRL